MSPAAEPEADPVAVLTPWLALCSELNRLEPSVGGPIVERLAELRPRGPWECLILVRLVDAFAHHHTATYDAKDPREVDRLRARADRQIMALMRMLDQHRHRRKPKGENQDVTPSAAPVASPSVPESSADRPQSEATAAPPIPTTEPAAPDPGTSPEDTAAEGPGHAPDPASPPRLAGDSGPTAASAPPAPSHVVDPRSIRTPGPRLEAVLRAVARAG